MIIGTVKELKNGENRVGLTPAGVSQLVENGHKILIEKNAGLNSGFPDSEYRKAGASIVNSAKEVWNKSEMIVKVKEPLKQEFNFLRENLVLFTYLHLAAEQELTKKLLEKKVSSIAYETVELDNGELPLLTPMSEIAGRMSIQIGMHYLEKTYLGSGVLLSGVPGVAAGKVTVIGTGVVGMNAARIADSVGAETTIIGRNAAQLRYMDELYKGEVKTLMSNTVNIRNAVVDSDLLIGAVAITGAKAPKLVTREMVKKMKAGSVIVDVAIDQGGCIETSRLTSHANPVYMEEGVIHYCVPNIPGAVPHTSTIALTNATLPYIIKLSSSGFQKAVKSDRALGKGVNTLFGRITNKGVAEAFKMDYHDVFTVLR